MQIEWNEAHWRQIGGRPAEIRAGAMPSPEEQWTTTRHIDVPVSGAEDQSCRGFTHVRGADRFELKGKTLSITCRRPGMRGSWPEVPDVIAEVRDNVEAKLRRDGLL